MTLRSCVLPESRHFRLDAWLIDELARPMTLFATSTQALVSCPLCRFPTRRVHSRDVRRVTDLPWGAWRVVLHLQVRKFFCANGRCPRHMYTERLLPLVAPWARRTQRLMHRLAHIAVTLGGRAGARLSCALGLPVSRPTLLRRLRRLPLPAFATPQVLGVDDWAAVGMRGAVMPCASSERSNRVATVAASTFWKRSVARRTVSTRVAVYAGAVEVKVKSDMAVRPIQTKDAVFMADAPFLR
jgi:transposase